MQLARRAVPRGVRERLLHRTQHRLDLGAPDERRGVEVEDEPGPRDRRAEPFERRAQVDAGVGAHLPDDAAQVLQQLVGEPGAELETRQVGLARVARERLEVELERREPVPGDVVELAREAQAFLVARALGEQRARREQLRVRGPQPLAHLLGTPRAAHQQRRERLEAHVRDGRDPEPVAGEAPAQREDRDDGQVDAYEPGHELAIGRVARDHGDQQHEQDRGDARAVRGHEAERDHGHGEVDRAVRPRAAREHVADADHEPEQERDQGEPRDEFAGRVERLEGPRAAEPDDDPGHVGRETQGREEVLEQGSQGVSHDASIAGARPAQQGSGPRS